MNEPKSDSLSYTVANVHQHVHSRITTKGNKNILLAHSTTGGGVSIKHEFFKELSDWRKLIYVLPIYVLELFLFYLHSIYSTHIISVVNMAIFLCLTTFVYISYLYADMNDKRREENSQVEYFTKHNSFLYPELRSDE